MQKYKIFPFERENFVKKSLSKGKKLISYSSLVLSLWLGSGEIFAFAE